MDNWYEQEWHNQYGQFGQINDGMSVLGQRIGMLDDSISALADVTDKKNYVDEMKLEFAREEAHIKHAETDRRLNIQEEQLALKQAMFDYRQQQDAKREEERQQQNQMRGMQAFGQGMQSLGNTFGDMSTYGVGFLSNTGFDRWRGGF